MKSNYKKLGDFIQQVKKRNNDNILTVDNLRGINISKEFMPSVANVTGTDLSVYKVVEKNQFAYNPMHVGRDEVLPISMLVNEDKVIVSPAYVIFEIVDTDKLLPEYLMIWCRRREFDRNAWFTTDSSVRGGFNWEDFCDLELPVPSLEKQKEIIKEYHIITDRIKLNEQVNQKLEDIAQSIYKEWFVNFEFPDENAKPYKSNGGEMVYCEELEMEIPFSWKVEFLGTLSIIKAGGDRPNIFSLEENAICNIPIYSNSLTNRGLFGFTNKATILNNSITISARGEVGYTELRLEKFVPIVRLLVVTPINYDLLLYLYYFLKNFNHNDSGSAQKQLTKPDIEIYKVLFPNIEVIILFQEKVMKIKKYIEINNKEKKIFLKLKEVLLSKMATIEG
ncbi:restriction endonuclease subunit S [Aliarcobacter butzleri]